MSDELVFDRAMAQLLAAERHVDRHIAAYADRDDLAGAQLLLETLRMVVEDALREVIARQRVLQSSSVPAGTRARHLKTIRSTARRTVMLVGQPLHYVVKSHGREFDPLAVAYGRMAREIEPNTELVFRGSEHRGYALSPSLLAEVRRSLVNRASQFVEQLDRLPTILYVQYPATAEGDAFQHLLVAHEVAHLALRRPDGKKERDQAEARFENAISAWQKTDPQSHKLTERIPADEEPSAWSARRERALSWFTELACDLLAVRLVGPAYYLALFEFALTRQWFYRPDDEQGDTHPHLAWRLERTQTQLNTFFKKLPQPLRGQIEAVFRPCIDAVPTAHAGIAAEPYAEVINSALDSLVQDLDDPESSVLGHAPLDPALVADELPVVLNGLADGFAPAERISWTPDQVLAWDSESPEKPPAWSTPLDWRSVVNGGYVHALREASQPIAPLREKWVAEDQARQTIINHIRGTVELTEFHRRARVAIDHLHDLQAPTV